MQDKQIYEYAVIRVVPKVEREEFLNVGIILYCSKQGFLQAKYQLEKERLEVFSKDTDYEELEKYLQTWERICTGGKNAGPIGILPIASRFRWLTATKDQQAPNNTRRTDSYIRCAQHGPPLFQPLFLPLFPHCRADRPTGCHNGRTGTVECFRQRSDRPQSL